MFLNLKKENEKVEVNIDPKDYKLEWHKPMAYIITREGKTCIGTFETEYVFDLPPRKTVILELRSD